MGYKSLAANFSQHVPPLLYNKLQLQRQALMYKPLREMTYQENKPVIVLTDVAQINPQEVKPQHLGRLSRHYFQFYYWVCSLVLYLLVQTLSYSAQSRNTFHRVKKKTKGSVTSWLFQEICKTPPRNLLFSACRNLLHCFNLYNVINPLPLEFGRSLHNAHTEFRKQAHCHPYFSWY